MRIGLKKSMPYLAEDLSNLVMDVQAYPKFIPWIHFLRAGSLQQNENHEWFEAEVEIGISILKERFSTRVTRYKSDKSIHINLLKGPFKTLKSNWYFSFNESNTSVSFDIDFEVKSFFLESVLKANLERAIDKLMICFEGRAAETLKPINQ